MIKPSADIKLTGRMQAFIRFTLLHLLLFTIFRAAFYIYFGVFHSANLQRVPLGAWYLGFKFDLRLALLLAVPFLLLSFLPFLKGRHHLRAARFFTGAYTFAGAGIFLIYAVDFGNFAYLHSRLNAQLFENMVELGIALRMVWQSYPILPMLAGFILLIAIYNRLLHGLVFSRLSAPIPERRIRTVVFTGACAFLIIAGGIYGKVAWYQLRWSDAFFSDNTFASLLALNPVLYLFDTYPHRVQAFDEDSVRDNYDILTRYFVPDHPDPRTLSFRRKVSARHSMERPPNIVLIHLESFSAFKTGIMGNRLHPTPAFDTIAGDGLLFTYFFVPRPPTARSIYAALFGIPDIYPRRSVSRNPHLTSQRTLINDFKGYQKFYFIGGDANWGNIRSLMQNNIEGLTIYEEGDYDAPHEDVWGVSDLHLLEAANKVLSHTAQPFFAFIQTAGNHRPYTIPSDNRGFTVREISKNEALANGFDDADAYNGMRFMDHVIGFFFKEASNAPYFHNTIFCLYGDHGSPSPSDIAFERLGLTSNHVPMVIYAPGIIRQGAVIDKTASSVDLIPTLLGLSGMSYLNTSLGRDILSDRPQETNLAYVNDGQKSGVLTDDFFLSIHPNGATYLYPYRSSDPDRDLSSRYPETAQQLKQLCLAVYECSKYLMYHNEKR